MDWPTDPSLACIGVKSRRPSMTARYRDDRHRSAGFYTGN